MIKFLSLMKIIIMQASSYSTIVTLLLIAATFHHTTLVEWGIDMPLWVFMGLVIAGGLLFLLFEKQFMLKGFYSSWNEQWWEGNNPIKKQIEDMQTKLDILIKEAKK